TWAGTGTLTNNASMTFQGGSTISSTFVQNGSVLVQGSNAGAHTTLTAASGFSNAGTITLQSIEQAWASNLTVSSGALTNTATGVININVGERGGDHTISADLLNNGTVNVNFSTTFSKPNGVLVNANAFNVA